MSEKTKNTIIKVTSLLVFAVYLWFIHKVSNISDDAWLYASGASISAALFILLRVFEGGD